MHIEIFTALKSAGVPDDAAKGVVDGIERHLAMHISQATQPILAKLDSQQAKMDSNQAVLLARIEAIAQVKAETDAERERRRTLVRWVIGTAIAAVAATLGVARALGEI